MSTLPSKSNQTPVIVTASFSLAASSIVLLISLYDSWRLRRKSFDQTKRNSYSLAPYPTSSSYVFPCTLAVASILQEFVVLIVQSSGTDSVYVKDCEVLSQITWITTWIVGYVLLVLAVLLVCRCITSLPTGVWNLLCCLGGVFFLLALTWIPSKARPILAGRCPTDVYAWLETWSDIGIVLSAILIFCYIGTIAALIALLRHPSKIQYHQKFVVRHSIYYLMAGMIILILTLPYWISSEVLSSGTAAGIAGCVAINLYGIVNGILFLVLRGSANRNFNHQNLEPAGKRQSGTSYDMSSYESSKRITIISSSNSTISPAVSHRNLIGTPDITDDSSLNPITPYLEESSRPVVTPVPSNNHLTVETQHPRLSNYTASVYTARPESRTVIFDLGDYEDVPLPPKPTLNHHRFSSSATVQIGLRLSHPPLSLHQRLNASTSNLPSTSEPHHSLTKERISTWRRSLGYFTQFRSQLRDTRHYSKDWVDVTYEDNRETMMPIAFRPDSTYSDRYSQYSDISLADKALPPIPLRIPQHRNSPSPLRPADDQSTHGTLKEIQFDDGTLRTLPTKAYSPTAWV